MLLNDIDADGRTALHRAVAGNDAKRVQQLLKDGADSTLEDFDGYTPLDWALEGGKHECAALLKDFIATAADGGGASGGDSSANSPSNWDQRGASEETWKAILEGAPSGTFVVRASNSAGSAGAAGEVVATISMVKQGGAGHFNQRIVRTTAGSSGSFKLKGSRHVHASLSALVAFYKDPMYFAQPGKPDVPAVLVEPTPASAAAVGVGVSHYTVMWWQQHDGSSSASTGTGTGTGTAESIYADIYDDVDGGTVEQQQFFERMVGGGNTSHYVSLKDYDPVVHMEKAKTPLLFLTEAVKILDRHCKGNMVAESKKALVYASTHAHRSTVQRRGAPPMGADDIASVYMYTMETDFYGRMNQELGGYGQEEIHGAVEHFLPITKLLMSSLAKLPPVPAGTKLFRGVKLPYKVILGEHIKVHDKVTWKQFTSCSTKANVLKCQNFLGEGVAGTVFQIITVTGVNIKPYSAIPDEDEILLVPGSHFVVDKITAWKYGVTEVRMREIAPEGWTGGGEVAAGGGRGGGGGGGAFGSSSASSNYAEVDQYMA